MIKALLKKQFAELYSAYFVNRKTGESRKKGAVIGYFILFAFLMLALGGMFFALAWQLAVPFKSAGLDWFYFAFMSLIAVALGVFGSVFNTYAGLYLAKDNEFMLSLPVKPSILLFTRMTGVYAMGLLYEALVMIPAVIAWIAFGSPSAVSVIFSVLLIFILGFVILALTCAIGFLVAVISSVLKNKSIITVFASLFFLAIYYFVYFKLNTFISNLATNGKQVAAAVKRWAYISYIFGKASTGDLLSMLIFTVFSAAVFAITYFILSKSFGKILTKSHAVKQKTDKKIETKQSGFKAALLKREFSHFLSSPTYMLNCGLGIVFMLAAAVFIAIKGSVLKEVLDEASAFLGLPEGWAAVAVALFVCLMNAMNDFTAPSVSLEGKSLWIVKSLPVSAADIFGAKQRMHIILAGVPTVILSAVSCAALGVNISTSVFVIVLCLVFAAFVSAAGLWLNLKMPNLNWTNETVPVKQSAPVFICLFGGWVLSVALAAAFFALRKTISTDTFLIAVMAAFALLTRIINNAIIKKGTRIFAEL